MYSFLFSLILLTPNLWTAVQFFDKANDKAEIVYFPRITVKLKHYFIRGVNSITVYLFVYENFQYGSFGSVRMCTEQIELF